ncbi:hypothetical protein PENSPDRAFT_737048 [Peniophora sp. CONT]|nr:hypothetical protein PENSPDRAFT_737048 [Peniophora sp. CONT]
MEHIESDPHAAADFDDELYLLTRNLVIAEDTEDMPRISVGEHFLPPEELLTSTEVAQSSSAEAHSRRRWLLIYECRIERNTTLLRRVLQVFQNRHSELLDHLATFDEANQGLYLDLRKRAQQTINPTSSIDMTRFHEDWSKVLTIDLVFYRHKRNPLAWDNRDESCVVAMDLTQAISWLYGAIDYLSESYTRIQKARVTLTPALLLDRDSLALIFDLVAESEPPSQTNLGWIRLGHVCRAWRTVLLGMRSVWARDAFVFGADVRRSKDILARADGSLVSVSKSRTTFGPAGTPQYRFDEVVTFLNLEELIPVQTEAEKGLLRELNVACRETQYCLLLDFIHHILGETMQPSLHSVNVSIDWRGRKLSMIPDPLIMANHPNLRHISFRNCFIPFALPSLVSLHLVCTGSQTSLDIRMMPRPWFDAMLDALKSSATLKDLRIIDWTLPPSDSDLRRIKLPHLDTICATELELLQRLELPELCRAQLAMDCIDSLDFMCASIQTMFQRYGSAIHSMQISQREWRSTRNSTTDILVVRLGWTSSSCPPGLLIPVDRTKILMEEPGPFLSLAYFVPRTMSAHTISGLFRVVCNYVSSSHAVVDLHAIGFDNETREHTFFNAAQPAAPFRPMRLPSFPSVQKVELPLRDFDSVYHLLYSLSADANIAHLPHLNCLRFTPVARDALDLLIRMRSILHRLLRARSSAPVSSITSLEFELSSPDGLPHSTWLKDIIDTILTSIKNAPATVIFHEQSTVNNQTNIFGLQLVVSIVYELSSPNV